MNSPHRMIQIVWLSLAIVCCCSATASEAESIPIGASFDERVSVEYPASPMVVDITKAPYHAKGGGTSDDTAAIQKALLDVMGQHKLLYFPNETYLVSKTLTWSKKNADGKDAWGKVFLQGQSAARTMIRQKDGTFPDASGLAASCGVAGLVRPTGFTTTSRI